jgi:hypothetical protein
MIKAALLLLSCALLHAGTIAVVNNAATGSGVMFFDSVTLAPSGWFTVASPLRGISYGAGSDLYLSSGPGVYHVNAGGSVLHSLPNSGADGFSDVSYRNGFVYIADNTSDNIQGVLRTDAALSILGIFSTATTIQGIAAGAAGEVYVAEAESVTRFRDDGTVLDSLGSQGADNFSSLSFNGTELFITDNSSIGINAVLTANASLALTNTLMPGFEIGGLAAGSAGDVFLTSGNQIVRYSSDGTLLDSYTGSVGDQFADLTFRTDAVPEPSTLSLAAAGAALLAALARRRGPSH